MAQRVNKGSQVSITQYTKPIDFNRDFDFKKSIERFGQIYPIITSQYGDIDGTHRRAKGCSDVKEIQVENEVDYWVLRYQLNERAKTTEEHQALLKECITNLARILKSEEPNILYTVLQQRIAEKLAMSPRTVRRYLPEEYKKWIKNRKTVPISKERSRVKSTLGTMDASQYPYLREILRDKKAYLHGDDVQRYFDLCSMAYKTKSRDFFTVFIEDFYLPREKKLKVPLRLIKGLKLAFKDSLDPYLASKVLEDNSYLVCEALQQFLASKDATQDQIVSQAKEELTKKWLIKEREIHGL